MKTSETADGILYEIGENNAGSGCFTGMFSILLSERYRMTAGGEL